MFKRIALSILAILIALTVIGYFVSPSFQNGIIKGEQKIWQVFSSNDVTASLQNDISSAVGSHIPANPPPNSPDVIAITNGERAKLNIGSLKENSELDAAAKVKLDDMFARQYFEHISPDGNGPGYLAEQAGYSYVIVGENLALGDFADTHDLMAAWMASPGHRANILNARFTDIGVAVGEGMYDGKEVWLAVQEFGAPLSSCPTIDAALKTKVDQDKAKTDSLSADLSAKHDAINAMSYSSPEQLAEYNAAVASYNTEAGEYSTVLALLQAEIATYNKEVNGFNACVAG